MIKKIYFVAVAFSLLFHSNTYIDAVSHISIKKLFYFITAFSDKHYNIQISALLRNGA